jgi:imidazolonepropionase-like amidohydrolase
MFSVQAAFAIAIATAAAVTSCVSRDTSSPPAVVEAGAREGGPTAFVSVSVVPMSSDQVLSEQTVLVRGDRIVAIGPVAQVAVPSDARRIDGRGMFLVPGLCDMHIHLMRGEVTAELALFLAYGVTTIRQMSGSPKVLELRQKVREGSVLGPTIFTVGPLVDGDPPVWNEGTTVVTTPDAARRAVEDQKNAGYDQVKVYDHLLLPEYDAIVGEAAKAGILVVGHLPAAVPLEHALDAKQASIEHLGGYLAYVQRADSPFRQVAHEKPHESSAGTRESAGQAPVGALEMAAWVDDARVAEIARMTASSGTWNVPTLVQLVNAKRADEHQAAWQRPGMQYATKGMRDWWNSDVDDTDPTKRARLLKVRSSIVRALHDAGARLLVGTDTPHPFVLAGLAVHDEMRNLVEAGLSPYEALRAATRGPAEFVGQPSEFGVIAQGARADLVLVDGDPLVDIANASHVAGVMLRGQWLSKESLRSLLEGLRTK